MFLFFELWLREFQVFMILLTYYRPNDKNENKTYEKSFCDFGLEKKLQKQIIPSLFPLLPCLVAGNSQGELEIHVLRWQSLQQPGPRYDCVDSPHLPYQKRNTHIGQSLSKLNFFCVTEMLGLIHYNTYSNLVMN